MNSEPCVRFGMRISPKISAKPAESRNSRPPNAMLFAASSQRFMRGDPCATVAGRSALQRRIVPRVDRLRQEPFLVEGPELADVLVGLDRRVDELAVLALAAADEGVADHVAEMVEVERPARAVGEADAAHRGDERLLVVGLAAGLLEGGLRHHAAQIEAGSVDAGDVAVVRDHALDELLVARRVE